MNGENKLINNNTNKQNLKIMRKVLSLFGALLFAGAMMAQTITVDGNNSEWASIPMVTEPGATTVLKYAVPQDGVNLGDGNAIAVMLQTDKTVEADKTVTVYVDADMLNTTGQQGPWFVKTMYRNYELGIKDNGDGITGAKRKTVGGVIEATFPANAMTDPKPGTTFWAMFSYDWGAFYVPNQPADDSWHWSETKYQPTVVKPFAYTALAGTHKFVDAYARHQCLPAGDTLTFDISGASYDTALWASWPVEIAKGAKYTVKADIYSSNSTSCDLYLVEVATNTLVSKLESSKISSPNGEVDLAEWDLSAVAAGKYMLMVKNHVAWSHGKLVSVTFTEVPSGPAPSEAYDYYLSNEYLYKDTKLTKDADGEDVEYFNAEGARIKLTADGWSDFHWNDDKGKGAAIFDGINLSHAGLYTLQFNSRGSGTALDIVVNGVTTTFSGDCAALKVEHVALNRGANVIQFKKNDGWYGVYSLTLILEADAPDYYLKNTYETANSQAWPVIAHDQAVYQNEVGLIKLVDDNVWSDFHWDGPSAVVFDRINLSAAGKYDLTFTVRNGAKQDIVVNGEVVATVQPTGSEVSVKEVALKEGMNTICYQKNDGWGSVKSLTIVPADPCGGELAKSADYYLTHSYLFTCTTLTKDEAGEANEYFNAEGGRIKLNGDGYSDFHWNDDKGKSAVIFDNINLENKGKYDITLIQKNGWDAAAVTVYVNGEVVAAPTLTKGLTEEVVAYDAVMNAGMNTIKIEKKADWPNIGGIKLAAGALVKDTTVITFDLQGGNGPMDAIKAVKGEELPALTALPTREGYFFNGFYDAAEDGVQYYDATGVAVKVWDKADATATLYAQWYNGAPEVEVAVECPDKATAGAPDYYLTNMYYALCTPWTARTVTDSVTGRTDIVYDGGAEVLINADGNWFKLCGDRQYIDWHWDDFAGKSSIVFPNIYVSESGDYDMHWYQRNGGTVDIILNGDTFKTVTAASKDTLSVFRMPLVADQANTVKIVKNNGWPQTLGIMFSKSEVVTEPTIITFDMQGGANGTESVTVLKGNDLPTVTIPVRDGYYFEGYFTEAVGGDQYYNPDGTGMKAWDKTDKTFTLYAHWNDGGTGGECPSAAEAIREDYFFNHMYDALCTELNNTWELDNGEYIYLNAEGERVKITKNGQWMDYYWADPSSVVFDSIYVSKDLICNFKMFFRCDNIDGEPTAGSRSQVWVNDELFGEVTVWISDEGVELDETLIEGIELYADWPNKIKIQKINGWPLIRGIQLVAEGMGVENLAQTSFFVSTANAGQMQINRLEGVSNINIYSISGALVKTLQTTEAGCVINIAPGSYLVSVNGEIQKAIVR